MKRRLAKLVVFLLLGAIVNVAVAWGCVLNWADQPTSVFGWLRPRLKYGDFVVTSVTAGATRKYFDARPANVFTFEAPEEPQREPLETDDIIFDVGVELYDAFRSLEQNEQLLLSDQPELTEWNRAIHTRVGWPLLALFGIQHFDWNGGWRQSAIPRHLIGAFAVPGGLPGINQGLALPLRPIWPGFTINTIFYAAVLWMLTLGPFAARRIIRNKRGHCLKCGYDLRGDPSSGCPECGWRRDGEA